jgi:hypothetical protein
MPTTIIEALHGYALADGKESAMATTLDARGGWAIVPAFRSAMTCSTIA